MTAILQLTDGTTVIDLLGTDGYIHKSWTPSIADYKGGGTWRESALSSGRTIVNKEFANAIETFTFAARGESQDELIHFAQDLKRMLEDASSYHVSKWNTTPVYLVSKGSCETNTRYAMVYRGRVESDGNPFSAPFLQPKGSAAFDGVVVAVERGHWQDQVPKSSSCVAVSGTQEGWEIGGVAVEFNEVLTNDDAWTDNALLTMYLNTLSIQLGDGNDGMTRFEDVEIPVGATITNAFIRFTASAADAANNVNITIQGNDVPDAAAFSTYAEYIARVGTAATVAWNAVGAWVKDNTYDTPDISTIVQEIIDRADWEYGKSMAFFLKNNASTGGANREAYSRFAEVAASTAAPVLHVTYTGEPILGREATCNDEVYTANKHNIAQLTHIFRNDGGAFSANLMGESAYALFPAVPAVGDYTLFGIDTAATGDGPFCSLVFDIGIAQNDLTIVWKYWDSVGMAWAALPNIQDNTNASGACTGQPFDTTGVESVHWAQVGGAVAPWGTKAENGVTAWWVIAEVTGVGVSPTPPYQQNRMVYTITWNDIDIDELQVGGDIRAVARYYLNNQANSSGGCNLDTDPGRYWIGLRSTDRGSGFTAWLCASDVQEPTGASYTEGMGGPATINDPESPTGRTYSIAGNNLPAAFGLVGPYWTVDSNWFGTFRVAARVYDNTGGGDSVYARIEASFGGATDEYSIVRDSVPLKNGHQWEFLDLGRITIPPIFAVTTEDASASSRIWLKLMTDAVAPGGTLYVYDIFLLPVDEYALEVYDLTLDDWEQTYLTRMDIDSISNPKVPIRAFRRTTLTDNIGIPYGIIAPDHAMLQANVDQQLWMCSMKWDATDEVYESYPWDAQSLQIFKLQQYLSMRGSR